MGYLKMTAWAATRRNVQTVGSVANFAKSSYAAQAEAAMAAVKSMQQQGRIRDKTPSVSSEDDDDVPTSSAATLLLDPAGFSTTASSSRISPEVFTKLQDIFGTLADGDDVVTRFDMSEALEERVSECAEVGELLERVSNYG